MRKPIKKYFLIVLTLLMIGLVGYVAASQWVGVQMNLDRAVAYIKGVISPAGAFPSAEKSAGAADTSLIPGSFALAREELSFNTPLAGTPLLEQVSLTAPRFDLSKDFQDWNNCGPATLALAMRYWKWEGDQFSISRVVKPSTNDKNVNMEELAGFVNQSAKGLQAEIRVGGDLSVLKRFLAAGYPVVIETGFTMEKPAWPGDDLWVGHFLLLTGFEEVSQFFTAQDTLRGPDQVISYDDLLKDWAAFNHVYLVIFPTSDLTKVQGLFGADWDWETNAQNTIARLDGTMKENPNNAFTWFSAGSNLMELQRFEQADTAFDKARELGLPQRMLRYQFGPLAAAYALGDHAELQRLADYALKITPESEEALFWKGRAFLMVGNAPAAVTLFEKALQINPGYRQAIEALREINPL